MVSGFSMAQRERRSPAAWWKRLAVVGLWIPLFALGTVLHESLHAVAVLLLGSHPELVLRPWAMALLPVNIVGIHVQPVPPLDPTRQALDNLLGPGVAAALFGVVATQLPRGVLRRAVIATALSLTFFAVIEPADVMLDGRLDLGFLTVPEFNYGVPLLLTVVVALIPLTRTDSEQRPSRSPGR